MKIRLLLDENTSEYILTDMLRKAGFDVVWLQHLTFYGSADENVLALALKEKRTLYTRDKGFIGLAKNVKRHSGIILEYRTSTAKNLTQPEIVKAMIVIEKQFPSLKNQFIIINSFKKR